MENEPDKNPGRISVLGDNQITERVNAIWHEITQDFNMVYANMPSKPMKRQELSFHQHVKLLGFLSFDIAELSGDILEIGVWKGKSLCLLERCNIGDTRIIGIDPCEIEGQREELTEFVHKLMPRANILVQYAERCVPDFLEITRALKLLHIDGGHLFHNVWLDFLLYSPFVISGGYIVFDDFCDHKHCPEVRPAVESLLRKGLLLDYDIIGVVEGFRGPFVIRKK